MTPDNIDSGTKIKNIFFNTLSFVSYIKVIHNNETKIKKAPSFDMAIKKGEAKSNHGAPSRCLL